MHFMNSTAKGMNMTMKFRAETRVAYVADDGQVFDTIVEAQEYCIAREIEALLQQDGTLYLEYGVDVEVATWLVSNAQKISALLKPLILE